MGHQSHGLRPSSSYVTTADPSAGVKGEENLEWPSTQHLASLLQPHWLRLGNDERMDDKGKAEAGERLGALGSLWHSGAGGARSHLPSL